MHYKQNCTTDLQPIRSHIYVRLSEYTCIIFYLYSDLTIASLLNSLGQNGSALSTASTVEFLHKSVNSCTA